MEETKILAFALDTTESFQDQRSPALALSQETLHTFQQPADVESMK